MTDNIHRSEATSRTRAPSGALVENRFLFSTSAPLGALVLLVASDVPYRVRVSPEQLEQLEQLQSAIKMASVNRIDSNFFM